MKLSDDGCQPAEALTQQIIQLEVGVWHNDYLACWVFWSSATGMLCSVRRAVERSTDKLHGTVLPLFEYGTRFQFCVLVHCSWCY